MPYFDVVCESHGKQEWVNEMKCPVCAGPVKRVWSSPASFRVEFRSGFDQGAWKYFDTKRDRDNWMAETNTSKVKD